MRAAAYLRVSTSDQDCASQRYAIEKWLVAHPGYEVTWFQDDSISGSTLKRPGLQALLRAVDAGEVDAVVTFRLDRLSRTACDALQILLGWMQQDIEFFATDTAILSLGRDNPLRLTITALFAELAQLERAAIISRVKAGLAAAKARGVRLGAERLLTPQQVEQARALSAAGVPMRKIGFELDVSAATISRALRRA